jgi:hypothetical protein
MSNYQPGPGEGRLGKQLKLISRHLDAAGNGTGNKNFVADYSGAQEIAYIQPPAGKIYRIARMLVLVSGRASSFKTDTYGSVPVLANGVQVRTQDDSGTIVDFTDGVPIDTNGCWGRLCFDSELYSDIAGTDTYLRVRWTFDKSGQQIRLVGDNNERLEVLLNDDFTDAGGVDALSKHHFLVQGYEEDPAEP